MAVAFGEELLAFYYFPAAHWRSLRTTNPIESTFAIIQLRTAKTRNCLSEKTALSLVHQFAMSAENRWHRLRSFRHLADVRFIDGIDEKNTAGGPLDSGWPDTNEPKVLNAMAQVSWGICASRNDRTRTVRFPISRSSDCVLLVR